MSEKTTEEIPTDETLQQMSDREILLTLLEKFNSLENKFDKFQKETNAQFETVRQGLVINSAAFDRLEATVYSSRSDVANLRADVKEMSEEVRRRKILA